jgi:tetratricopeptide (TPR) repeat protein
LCIGIFAVWQCSEAPVNESPERLFLRARLALQRNQFDLAERLASRIPAGNVYCATAKLVAGEAATRAGRLEAAARYYRAVPRDGSLTAVTAAFSLGEISREIGRLSDAEREYAYVLDEVPENPPARKRMAFLCGITGRRWESLPLFIWLIRNGSLDWEELCILGDLERAIDQGEYLRRCAANVPGDLLVETGLAANELVAGETAAARLRLTSVVARAPGLIGAQAMLGELLLDGEDAALASWHAGLPPEADADPDIWLVRGLYSRRSGELRVAARCFWEAVRRVPTHRRAGLQLGQLLVALGETSGRKFSERSAELHELTKHLENVLRSKGHDETEARRVTEILEDVGRILEACAWASAAAHEFPAATWPNAVLARLLPLVDASTPQTLASSNLSLDYDLSQFPDHVRLFSQINRGTSSGRASTGSTIRFEESLDAGIDFVYVNGSDPLTEPLPAPESAVAAVAADARVRIRSQNRTRIFEQNGGAAAAIDFDGDGWPDLFFTQGAKWPHGAAGPILDAATNDRLYRNAGGQTFIDVTHQSALVDRGFGQGCAAGDYDNDGFPDLYVANIGRNQLHHNNGDGTFSGATEDIGFGEETWTASCVIVDLNADGLPDLFDATYLTGPHVYDAICKGHVCPPTIFEGIPDRLHLNCGDGTFEFAPDLIPESSSSKGLGVVAFDLDVRGRPSLFVANDQVSNFLLRNYSADDRRRIRLVDEGFSSGLAYNSEGLAPASMGIAADDVDGDGRIDFFITTFKDEPRTLYLQDATGLFVDATNRAGLRTTGLPFVGWGTQFIDADCDGEPDIVIANGHVDDYRSEGGEYHMRPQILRNLGAGKFIELTAAQAGSYFQRKYLGRGLARLDWNRDGRMDFVVSNIGATASLVTNRSTGAGNYINVRLHARATARDAIGSIVDVEAGTRRWSKQLVAGDGYMASNERMLQFGLADAGRVRKLSVHWPSGQTTTLRDLPVDVTVELVEGASRGTLWRGGEPESLALGPTATDHK